MNCKESVNLIVLEGEEEVGPGGTGFYKQIPVCFNDKSKHKILLPEPIPVKYAGEGTWRP